MGKAPAEVPAVPGPDQVAQAPEEVLAVVQRADLPLGVAPVPEKGDLPPEAVPAERVALDQRAAPARIKGPVLRTPGLTIPTQA